MQQSHHGHDNGVKSPSLATIKEHDRAGTVIANCSKNCNGSKATDLTRAEHAVTAQTLNSRPSHQSMQNLRRLAGTELTLAFRDISGADIGILGVYEGYIQLLSEKLFP